MISVVPVMPYWVKSIFAMIYDLFSSFRLSSATGGGNLLNYGHNSIRDMEKSICTSTK